ncbi:MAG: DUF1211 domain-containing protein [Gammaproteobacteria bacterium]|nr:MAG: DUF1211 domain-containing protein [Gammaproteobacteria bacterium]
MSEALQAKVGAVRLRRLETFTDCVYAIAVVLVIGWLPMPEESLSEGPVWIGELFVDHAGNLLHVFIAMLFIVLYWLRSNKLMGYLDRTDGIHTAFSIAQVFFILLLLYVVRYGQEVVEDSRRATESVALVLTGLAGAGGWWYAKRKEYHLVDPHMTKKEKLGVQLEAFTEPLTAMLTLPFAYMGEMAWNLSWLLVLPISALLKKRANV